MSSSARAALLLGAVCAGALIALVALGAGNDESKGLPTVAGGPQEPVRGSDGAERERRAVAESDGPSSGADGARRATAARGDQSFACIDLAELRPGARPPACWRPFADDSPFNRRIPATAPLDPDSERIVAFMTLYGGPASLVSNGGGSATDYSHANYFARPGDPVYSVHCTNDWGACEPEGKRFLIPSRAVPAGHESADPGLDHHMSVAQPDGTTLDLWRAQIPSGDGGTLDAAWGGLSRIDGDGLGSNATAAMFSGFAGVIRAEELAAGRIDHALFAVVPCTTGHAYPALQSAAECGASDAPPNGARLRLDMTAAEIDALAVPRWKQTILLALSRYGMIVGDTGGSGAFGLQLESGIVDRAYGRRERIDRYATAAGLPERRSDSTGRLEHVFDLDDGVDWGDRLRVVDPCVSAGTC
jgi:hypothetical protein